MWGVLVGILIVAALVFYQFRKGKQQKAEQLSKLPGLATVVNGTVQGGAVLGTFGDLPAKGEVVSEVERDSDGDRVEYHYWCSQLQVPLSSAAFELGLQAKGFLGMGKAQLEVTSKDPNYKAWLEAAGMVQFGQQIPSVAQGNARIKYSGGVLIFRESINHVGSVPEPAHFHYHLQVLQSIVQMHQQTS